MPCVRNSPSSPLVWPDLRDLLRPHGEGHFGLFWPKLKAILALSGPNLAALIVCNGVKSAAAHLASFILLLLPLSTQNKTSVIIIWSPFPTPDDARSNHCESPLGSHFWPKSLLDHHSHRYHRAQLFSPFLDPSVGGNVQLTKLITRRGQKKRAEREIDK